MTQRAVLVRPGCSMLLVGREADVARRLEEELARLRDLGLHPREVPVDDVAPWPPRRPAA